MKPSIFFSILTALILFVGWALGSARLPLVAAFFLAYLLFPVIYRLEKYKLNRYLIAIIVLSLGPALVAIMALTFGPKLYQDLRAFLTDVPQLIDVLTWKVQNFLTEKGIPIRLEQQKPLELFRQYITKLSLSTFQSWTDVALQAFSSVVGFVVGLLNFVLFPVFFYFIIDRYERIRKYAIDWVPQRHVDYFILMAGKVEEILNGFIRGQLIVCTLLAILYVTALSIIGIRFGVLIGVMTGCLYVLPYVGVTLGFATALTVALATDCTTAQILAVVVVFGVIPVVEGFYFTPRVVGNKVGLGTLGTILALIVGGNVAGILGMMVAIPVAAVLKLLFWESKKAYWRSEFYLR